MCVCVCLCAAFAYMSVLGASVSPEYTSIPLSLSLNDLKSHSRSFMHTDDLQTQSRSLLSPGWNVHPPWDSQPAAWDSPSAEGTAVKFSVSTSEECRSVRQHSIESSLSANVFIDSDSSGQSLWSYSQPSAAVNSMVLEGNCQLRQRSVDGCEVFVSSQQSIGPVPGDSGRLGSGACLLYTSPSPRD